MRNFVRPAFLAAALAAVGLPAIHASAQSGPYIVVETGQSFTRLQDAINSIDAGIGTIRIAPGRYADCGVQQRGDIRYLAAVQGQAVFDSVTCEGQHHGDG